MIYRAAGVCGVDPHPLTFGELSAMLEARERSEWARTSSTLCMIASGFVGLGGKRKKFKPSDFDPFAAKKHKTVDVREFGALVFGIKKAKKAGKKVPGGSTDDAARRDAPGGPADRVPG